MTSLTPHGPLVPIKLWVPPQVHTTLPPIDAIAEISTAHAHTYIQEGIATSLGLTPAGTLTITTALKLRHEAPVYRIRVAFPERNKSFMVEAVEIPYMFRVGVRIRCIIGRDILRYSVMIYNGVSDVYSLDF